MRMYSIRKWIFRPKRSDQSLLAGFFYADEDLNMVATELDSFDGRKDPERCTALVNQLRMCQDKVLSYIERIIEECVPLERASRDFRVKFPDDVLQESLSGQLWFGAECLAAGSSIMNREVESASMRPLAKSLTRLLDYLRALLRDQCLRNINIYTDRIKDSLIQFDRLFAEFELSYVSAMVPVKTMKEYDVMQEVIVLFSETTQRALRLNLLTQDMIDDYDPALMFTIPRLAIVAGLLVYPEGPLNPDMDPVNMSEMFRPFQTLLYKIRELLWTLSKEELWLLEKSLCSAEEQGLYRDLTSISFPDDFDPYEDLSVEHADLMLEGAMALQDIEPDVVESLLTVEKAKYGYLSHSPSTITLVANPDVLVEREVSGNMDEDGQGESCRQLHMAKQSPAMPHQPCNDSSLLSENSSTLNVGCSRQHKGHSGSGDCVSRDCGSSDCSSEAGCSSAVAHSSRESCSLRHSVSWPEATLRTRRRTRYLNSDTSQLGLLEDSGEMEARARPICTHSHEFNFHLPLNTETNGESLPQPSPRCTRTPTNAVDLGSTRVFYLTDYCEDDPQYFSSSSSGTHISYVTETLNEVFVTDPSSFHNSLISAVTSKALSESMGICCKCGNKTCGTAELNSQNARGESSNYDGIHTHSVDEMNEVNMCTNQQPQNTEVLCQQMTGVMEGEISSTLCSGESPASERDSTSDTRDQTTELNTDRCTLSAEHSQHQVLNQHQQEPDSVEVAEDAVAGPLVVSPASSEEEKSNTELTEKDTKAEHSNNDYSRESHDQRSTEEVSESGAECQCGPIHEISCDMSCKDVAEKQAEAADSTVRDCSSTDSDYQGQCRKREGVTTRGSLEVPRVQRLRYSDGPTMMCSVCNHSRRSSTASADVDWDRESYNSSETSSYNSDCHDDEEIALAIQAAELASRREARSRFKSSNDLIHRLFVCISGVADQLQTNYAADLRHILKVVFECNSSELFLNMEGSDSDEDEDERTVQDEQLTSEQHEDSSSDNTSHTTEPTTATSSSTCDPTTSEEADPPKWVPDNESPHCESCQALFTFVRRRHHCRNCGKIFCGRCSSNAVPLPHYGHTKPVRVCNRCFMFQVNPFTVDE